MINFDGVTGEFAPESGPTKALVLSLARAVLESLAEGKLCILDTPGSDGMPLILGCEDAEVEMQYLLEQLGRYCPQDVDRRKLLLQQSYLLNTGGSAN